MEVFPSTVLILFTAFTICHAVSFPRDRFYQEDDDEIPRHVLPKKNEHKRALGKENFRKDLEKELLSKIEGSTDKKRENAAEASWMTFMRRQRALEQEREREKEILMKELLSDMKKRSNTIRVPAKARSVSAGRKIVAESLPKMSESSLGSFNQGNHREREKEVEKIRNDHHGRKERVRIHQQERERKQNKIINNRLVDELEKEMRGQRQRMINVGGRLREQKERFRERERSRFGASKE